MLVQLECFKEGKPSSAVEKRILWIEDWYCKPSILCSIARSLHCVFIAAPDIYGCKQFIPTTEVKEKLYKVRCCYFDAVDNGKKLKIIPEFTSLHEDLYK